MTPDPGPATGGIIATGRGDDASFAYRPTCGYEWIMPCADTPYSCEGADPADWPGDVPAAVHELAAILARNSATRAAAEGSPS
jgi:hypothetical protein